MSRLVELKKLGFSSQIYLRGGTSAISQGILVVLGVPKADRLSLEHYFADPKTRIYKIKSHCLNVRFQPG